MPKKRVSSGVKGLDDLLAGGYVEGRSTLLAGGPGTGKSILTWHFLFDGIAKGEKGILVSLDQTSDMITEDMTDFGWDPEPALKSGNLTVLSGNLKLIPTETSYEYVINFKHPLLSEQPFTVPRLAELVRKKAAEVDAKRVVIDGLGPLLELAGNRSEIRQLVYGFIREISDGANTILLTHELKASKTAQNDEMPFFICDGVLKLDTLYSGGDYLRTMRIVKMRGANHIMRPVMFKIGNDGIVAFPDTRLPD
ncbi:MAG: ATPase domain-containing protein [Candidatus Thorarchaeota archaeon]